MSSTSTSTGTDDALLKQAQTDLASLDRVSHRIALTEGDRFAQVLDKLLPRLLLRLGDNHQKQQLSLSSSQLQTAYSQIHTKLVEMLSHIMKRVRADSNCVLPCLGILQLLLINENDTSKKEEGTKEPAASTAPSNVPSVNDKVDPFTLNLALAFLLLGVPRIHKAPTQSYTSVLPGLLVWLGYTDSRLLRSDAQRMQAHQIAQLCLQCLQGMLKEETATDLTDIRASIISRPHVASALYDLLLDVLLFRSSTRQTTATATATGSNSTSSNSTIPPPGTSQRGAERLRSMRAMIVDDVHSNRNNMLTCTTLLEAIAPSRRWALFLPDDATTSAGATDEDDEDTRNTTTSLSLGGARTVALLVVATAEPGDVGEQAKLFLKQYLDSTSRGSGSNSGQQQPSHAWGADAMMVLTLSLLSLCLGQTHAEAALSGLFTNRSAITLGTMYDGTTESAAADRQVVLSTKRRPVSESTMTCILQFVTKLLMENPHLLDRTDNDDVAILGVGTLAVQLSSKTLQNVSLSGMSTLRAKPYTAAAELLSTLVVRLTFYYDGHYTVDESSEHSSVLVTLLARSLSTVCSLLRTAIAQRPTAAASSPGNSSEGIISVRDSCYGVICTLSRSRFALSGNEMFACGESSSQESSSMRISMETAKLLFTCAAKEEERLRPRAVAALDALLAAYCRIYTKPPAAAELNVERSNTSDNPWLDQGPTLSVSRMAISEDGSSQEGAALAKAIIPLIWTAAQSYQPKASRVAAAKWSSDLLKALDRDSAYHLLCFLSGDADPTAASLAREGLGLARYECDDQTMSFQGEKLPEFSQFVQVLFQRSDKSSVASRVERYWDFSFEGKAATLRFGLICLLNDLYGGEDQAVDTYLGALSQTLSLFKRDFSVNDAAGARSSIDLLDVCSKCLLVTLSTSQYARAQILGGMSGMTLEDMKSLVLEANSSKARRRLAGACGELYKASEIGEGVNSFSDWSVHSQVGTALVVSAEKLETIETNSFVLRNIHGSAFLGAHAVRAFRLKAATLSSGSTNVEHQLWEKAASVLAALGHGVLHSDEVIGNACADSLAIALSYEGLDAPVLDPRLYSCSASILRHLATSLAKYGHGDSVDPIRAMKLANAAGVCLASTTTGSGIVSGPESTNETIDLGPSRMACVEALFDLLGSMSFRKEEEIALSAGEALAAYGDGYSDNAVWSTSNDSWPAEYNDAFASRLPPHDHVLYVLLNKTLKASNPHKRTSAAPALLAVVARAAKGVNSNPSYARRALVKALLGHLSLVQQAFLQLLKDPKSRQLCRESCCLGLAACRGVAGAVEDSFEGVKSEELNDSLLRAFGQTTNYGGSAMMETRAQAAERRAAEGRSDGSAVSMEAFGVENEVGGASGMSEAALGAYREMAAASVALGRYDILYALLMLSVSHSCWYSTGTKDRYSASSLLGENSFIGRRANLSEIQDALRPHLGKLLPRILRARHDPNKQTRDQMSSLWDGLTGGGAKSRLVISQHLLSTIDSLVEDASSKFWRARVGACGALAEIIVGRDWTSLGGGGPVLDDDDLYARSVTSAGTRLLRLWRVAMRSLDDVRGAVREMGATLARAVRALTIRLCDPSMVEKTSGAKRGREELVRNDRQKTAASATSLRWLIRHGLNQPCPEATGICVSTLVEAVGVVNPKILEPILPDLLRSLLLAISGLEPAALNFLQLRTSDHESLERIRLRMVQSGPLATAVSKCLELLPGTDIQTQCSVVPQLDSALRLSAGFATRAATADAVSTLCSTCPSAFRFSGTSTSNPSVRLLRAFYFASERERGQAAKEKMIHALGNLAALCPGSSVRALAKRACERYNSSTGSNDDPVTRRAAASALRAIFVRSGVHLADGGSADVWRSIVLPVAFLGRKDCDPKIASLWKEVWNEGGAACGHSQNGNVASFGTRLEERILPFLIKECTRAMQDVSWSRRVAGANAISDLSNAGILSPIPRSSSSTQHYSSSPRAQQRAKASSCALYECVDLLTKPRLWTGKNQVLKAAVDLTSKWIGAEVTKENDEKVLYGWDNVSSVCPWKPVSLSSGKDLFVGDQFFQTAEEKLEIESEAPDEQFRGLTTEAMKIDDDISVDDGNETAMNFGECDTILVGDEDGSGSETDTGVDMVTSPLTFVGFCWFLIEQATKQSQTTSDESLPYRTAAFRGFCDLLRSLPHAPESENVRGAIYTKVSPKCRDFIYRVDIHGKCEPPVLVAGSVNCLAASLWIGFGSKEQDAGDNSNVLELAGILKSKGGSQQPAWTVREACTLCVARIASTCHASALRQHALISTMVDCSRYALTDKKFWKVRYAGVKVIESLTSRVGGAADKSSQENQLILEAILPYKEEMLRLIRSSLSDSEPQVTATCSAVLSSMAWWP